MRAPTQRPNLVTDVLSDVLKRVDPEHQLDAYRIWTFWNNEVGDVIARRAQPSRFRNGILFVTVATHSWMQELQFMKETICERLNARLGAGLVRDIFFISGSVESEIQEAQSAPQVTQPVDPALAARALATLPPIADPELAAVFARIVEARAKRLSDSQPTRKKRR